uniref:2'-5' RNA ligase family protein n=1 Tax=Aggregatilinea sp. TaxID=2806333 RepID=UPI002C41F4D6
MSDSNTPQHIYDHLWANARAAFDAGEIVPDPWLGRGDDTRRGLTLIARPDAPTRERIAAFIEDLQGCAPDQYFYRPDQLHITVLALVAASEAFDLARVPVAQYETALADLFAGCAPFRVRIDQVVAAPDAVIVCGDADGGALNAL